MKLSENGFRVILIGGELKAATEAIVGNEAYAALQKYNFTKGFWGTNGVSELSGFTTPDINEAMIKGMCHEAYTKEICSLRQHEIPSDKSGEFRRVPAGIGHN